MNGILEIMISDSKAMAATTCRGHRADSADPYSGFSVCRYTGDCELHYSECLTELANEIGIDPDRIVMPRQTHTANVALLTESTVTGTPLNDTDALVTNIKNLVIGINTADCVPVLLVDETGGVAAACHAGWRGAVSGIVAATVAGMKNLGADISATRAFIAPCICERCFEVGPDVAAMFDKEFVNHSYGEKPHVDLPGAVASMLQHSGILSGNIKMPHACTRCSPDRYFSARASGVASGRNFSFVYLK